MKLGIYILFLCYAGFASSHTLTEEQESDLVRTATTSSDFSKRYWAVKSLRENNARRGSTLSSLSHRLVWRLGEPEDFINLELIDFFSDVCKDPSISEGMRDFAREKLFVTFLTSQDGNILRRVAVDLGNLGPLKPGEGVLLSQSIQTTVPTPVRKLRLKFIEPLVTQKNIASLPDNEIAILESRFTDHLGDPVTEISERSFRVLTKIGVRSAPNMRRVDYHLRHSPRKREVCTELSAAFVLSIR